MKYYLLAGIVCLFACTGTETQEEMDETAETTESAGAEVLFIGTYSKKEGHVDGKGPGLVVLDTAMKTLHVDSLGENPTFFTFSSDRKYVYVVNETGADLGESGSVQSYEILDNGELLHLTTQSSEGFYPCHIVLTADDKYAIVSNYAGGLTVLPIDDMHQLQEPTQTLRFEGGTSHPRQDASHPHSAIVSPNGEIYVADLGTNKVMLFRLVEGTLQPHEQPFIEMEEGAGPRHMVFHPSENYLYVINELNSTITKLIVNADGSLEMAGSVSTLPNDFEGVNYCADIHFSEDGKYVYGSNRGHNSIAIFAVNDTGDLTPQGHQTEYISWPRNFMIKGQTLWSANRNDDNVVIFNIQPDGTLAYREEFAISTPVCLGVGMAN